MILWRSLLLIYPEIDVSLPGTFGLPKRFAHRLPKAEIQVAVDSFRGFPALVSELTDNQAGIQADIVESESALSTLTQLQGGTWWPSPDDTGEELERHFASSGGYDSIFIFWPQNDWQHGTSIKSGAWGLGLGPSPWSLCATYATVANAQSWAWEIPRIGEVWLHEWLHGVCGYFAQQDYCMPDGDADGADRHGYTRSPTDGWMGYYRDLMNGAVEENGETLGIPSSAWSRPYSYRLEA